MLRFISRFTASLAAKALSRRARRKVADKQRAMNYRLAKEGGLHDLAERWKP
jgi:hypothetical protein